jgi:hypothetical protein
MDGRNAQVTAEQEHRRCRQELMLPWPFLGSVSGKNRSER